MDFEKSRARTMEALSKGKRISDRWDDPSGLGIAIWMPGARQMTEQERRERDEMLEANRKRQEEQRIRYLIEHPPLDVQLQKMLAQIQALKERYPNEKAFGEMEATVNQTAQDHLFGEDCEADWD